MSDGEVGGRAGVGSGRPTQHAGSCAATGASTPWVGPVRVEQHPNGYRVWNIVDTAARRLASVGSLEMADAITAKLNAPAAGCGCAAIVSAEAVEQSSAGLDAGGAGNMVEFEVRERVVMVLRILATRLPAPSEKQGGIADGEIARLTADLAYARRCWGDVDRKLSATGVDLARLTAECERLRGERDAYEAEGLRVDADRDALRDQLATVTRERDDLTGERDRMRAFVEGVRLALKGGAA